MRRSLVLRVVALRMLCASFAALPGLFAGGCVHSFQAAVHREYPPLSADTNRHVSITLQQCELKHLEGANVGARIQESFVRAYLQLLLSDAVPALPISDPRLELARPPEIRALGVDLGEQEVVTRIQVAFNLKSGVALTISLRLHLTPEIYSTGDARAAVLRFRIAGSLIRLDDLDLGSSDYDWLENLQIDPSLVWLVNTLAGHALESVNGQITPAELPLELVPIEIPTEYGDEVEHHPKGDPPAELEDSAAVALRPVLERAVVLVTPSELSVLGRLEWKTTDVADKPEPLVCKDCAVGRTDKDVLSASYSSYERAFKSMREATEPTNLIGDLRAWIAKKTVAKAIREGVTRDPVDVAFVGPLGAPLDSGRECADHPDACDVVWHRPSFGFLCDWFEMLDCGASERCVDVLVPRIQVVRNEAKSSVDKLKANYDSVAGELLQQCCNVCGCDGGGNCGGSDLERWACEGCMHGIPGCGLVSSVNHAYNLWRTAEAELARWEEWLREQGEKSLGGIAGELGIAAEYEKVCSMANRYLTLDGVCREFKSELAASCRHLVDRIERGIPFDCEKVFGQGADICDKVGDRLPYPDPLALAEGKKIGTVAYKFEGDGDDSVRASGTISALSIDDELEKLSAHVASVKGTVRFDGWFDFSPEPLLLPICPNECYPEVFGDTLRWTCRDSGVGLNNPVYKNLDFQISVPEQELHGSLTWEEISAPGKDSEWALFMELQNFDVKLEQPARMIRCVLGGNCGSLLGDPGFRIRFPCALNGAVWLTEDFVQFLAVSIDGIDEMFPDLASVTIPWKDNPKFRLLNARAKVEIEYAWVEDPGSEEFRPTKSVYLPYELGISEKHLTVAAARFPEVPKAPPELPDFPKKDSLMLRFGLTMGLLVGDTTTTTPDERGRGLTLFNPYLELSWRDPRLGILLGTGVGPGLDSTGIMAGVTYFPWKSQMSKPGLESILRDFGSDVGFYVGSRWGTGSSSNGDHGANLVVGATWQIGEICTGGCF